MATKAKAANVAASAAVVSPEMMAAFAAFMAAQGAPAAVKPAATIAPSGNAASEAAIRKALANAKLLDWRVTAKKGVPYAVVEINVSGKAQKLFVYA